MDVYGHLFPDLDDALAIGLDAVYRRARSDEPRDQGGMRSAEVVALRAENSL